MSGSRIVNQVLRSGVSTAAGRLGGVPSILARNVANPVFPLSHGVANGNNAFLHSIQTIQSNLANGTRSFSAKVREEKPLPLTEEQLYAATSKVQKFFECQGEHTKGDQFPLTQSELKSVTHAQLFTVINKAFEKASNNNGASKKTEPSQDRVLDILNEWKKENGHMPGQYLGS